MGKAWRECSDIKARRGNFFPLKANSNVLVRCRDSSWLSAKVVSVDNLSKMANITFDDEDMIYAPKKFADVSFSDLRLMPASWSEDFEGWQRDHANRIEVLVRQGRIFVEGRVVYTGNLEARFCSLCPRPERAKYMQDSKSSMFAIEEPEVEFVSITGGELGQYIWATINVRSDATGQLVICRPDEPRETSKRDEPYACQIININEEMRDKERLMFALTCTMGLSRQASTKRAL